MHNIGHIFTGTGPAGVRPGPWGQFVRWLLLRRTAPPAEAPRRGGRWGRPVLEKPAKKWPQDPDGTPAGPVSMYTWWTSGGVLCFYCLFFDWFSGWPGDLGPWASIPGPGRGDSEGVRGAPNPIEIYIFIAIQTSATYISTARTEGTNTWCRLCRNFEFMVPLAPLPLQCASLVGSKVCGFYFC